MKYIILIMAFGLSINCNANVLDQKYIGSECEKHEGTEFLANCYLKIDVQLPENFKAIMCYGEIKPRAKQDNGSLIWLYGYGFLSNIRFANYEEIRTENNNPPLKFKTARVNFPKEWRITEIKYMWSKCEAGDKYYDL